MQNIKTPQRHASSLAGSSSSSTYRSRFPVRIVTYAVLLLCLTCAPALAGFTGPVVSVIDGDTIEVLHYTQPERVRLSGIDCPEKGQAFGNRAKQAVSALVFGRESSSRPTARTSTDAPLETSSCWMALTSTIRWSKTVGVGGIGSMRRQTRCWKGWRRKHEKPRKVCGLIQSRCRRGSGGSQEFLPAEAIHPFAPLVPTC